MWWRGEPKKIFAYGEPIDMRCSFDGLVAAVKAHLGADPLTGDFYVFVNRRRTLLKGVFWDRTGWCVFAKRLERGRFEVRSADGRRELASRELDLLLDGVLRGFARTKRARINKKKYHWKEACFILVVCSSAAFTVTYRQTLMSRLSPSPGNLTRSSESAPLRECGYRTQLLMAP